MTLIVILGYIVLLLSLGLFSTRLFKKTSGDYFLASRGIGPFMLLMSIFGTTMTAFALVGSTGRTFEKGVGVYGLMASWSGIIHSACFFLLGAKVWAFGKKHGYLTQISFFRDRYRSAVLGVLLFLVMVPFVMIYILMGVVGSGRVISSLTPETWACEDVRTEITVSPEVAVDRLEIPSDWQDRLSWDSDTRTLGLVGSIAPKRRSELMRMNPGGGKAWAGAVGQLIGQAPRGAVPYGVGMGLICLVVLIYVFFGGMRATAWANTFQTIVFMIMGLIAFAVILSALGGPEAATQQLLESPGKDRMVREGHIGQMQFLTYCFIPLSVGMFPHLFQHWLTAKSGNAFKLTVVAHPLCIAITWIPCVLLGMWAASVLPLHTNPNAVLGMMVNKFSGEILSGLIGAGILAAIMSSMDSQFLCLGSMFTNDFVVQLVGKDRFSDRQRIQLGRVFVFVIVLVTFLIGLFEPATVFPMGVWCFSGFASLFPVAFAAVYWKRSNKYGAIAAVLSVAVLWCVFLPEAIQGEFLIAGMMPVTVLFVVSTTALVLGTLLTPAPENSLVEKFFPKAEK